ncbi:MAG: phage tail tube protein [Rhodospirillales bacterium]|nr:phage tail tube protein [Rhodospirillales bacterium]
MAQSLGVVDIIWAGQKLPIEKGATFKQGGLINKSVMAGRQVFYSQEMMPTEVKASTPLQGGQSMAAILAASPGELQFVCDTGQTYVVTGAFIVDQAEITGGEGGKMTLVWNGPAAEELIST